jgi:hypothetical protein
MATHIIVSRGEKSEQTPTIASTQVVRPERLDEAGRAALLGELLALNQKIFEGPGVQAITEALVKGLAGKTTLQLYFNARQQCVGYAALLCDEFRQEGKPWSVFRAMTGLLPEYRGRQRVLGFYLSQLTGYLLRNPRRRAFFFTPLVHISSYRVVARHAWEMYPHPERAVPTSVMKLMQQLGARYHLTSIKGEHPLVCRRPMWVRGSHGSQARQGQTRDVFDRYFEQINPRSSEGRCVMTLAPLSLGQMAFSAVRYALTRVPLMLLGLWEQWVDGLGPDVA